jgi:hypothetical protein
VQSSPSYPALTSPISVFLSHSMQDGPHVAQVQRQLEALGIKVWLAEHDLRPGTSILDKIESVLPTCDVVVFLITTNSVNSAYVQQEVGMARTHRKPMVPLVEKRVDKSRLGLLGELEWIELDLDAPSEAFAKVTQVLQALVLAQLRSPAAQQNQPRQAFQLSDAAVALLVIGLSVALAMLITSYKFHVEIGPA